MLVTSRRLAARNSPLLLQQQRSISHIEKNEKLGRPVSPHVTIYAFPLAAWSSVGHRVTGALLTVGMYGIGIGALAGMDVTHLMYAVGASGVAPLAKFAVSFPVTFHGLGGVRHLYWEHYPDNLSPETQRQASIALLVSSGAISAVLAAL